MAHKFGKEYDGTPLFSVDHGEGYADGMVANLNEKGELSINISFDDYDGYGGSEQVVLPLKSTAAFARWITDTIKPSTLKALGSYVKETEIANEIKWEKEAKERIAERERQERLQYEMLKCKYGE